MWRIIDRAVCITTNNSDRIDDFIKDSKRVGLNVDIDFNSRVERSEICSPLKIMKVHASCCDNTCQSLTKNHLRLIKESYDKGHQRILIFEDDARWNKPLDKNKLKRSLQWIEENDPDIFFFGYVSYPNVLGRSVNKDIVQTFNPLLSHAYILNRKAMNFILNDYNKIIEENIAIDNYYAYYTSKMKKYAVFPSLNYQCAEPYYFKKTKEALGLEFISFNTFMNISNTITYYSDYFGIIIIGFVIVLIVILIIVRILINSERY